MSNPVGIGRRYACALESYELLGIGVVLILAVVFFAFAPRMERVLGLGYFSWPWLNDLIGLFRIPWTWVFILTVGLLLSGHVFLRQSAHARSRFIAGLCRVLVSFVVMMTVYKVVNFYIAVFNPFDRDLALQSIDKMLFFGKMPSQWLEPLVYPFMDWWMGLSYLSWFVLTYITVVLMMQQNRRAVREYMLTAMLTFYLGYSVYALVPAIGPEFTVHYQTKVGPVVDMLVMGQTILARDCFPSLHTGISLVMAINIWRHNRAWSWLYFPLITCIIASTLYLRVHYGLDVIAGAALACVTTQIGPLVVRWWERAVTPLLDTAGTIAEVGSAASSRPNAVEGA